MRTHRSALLLGTLVLAAGGVLAGAPSAGATAAEDNCNYIADSARPTVHPGDKGNNVRQVQSLIDFYSNYPMWIDVDGDYGQKTQHLVPSLQPQGRLRVVGPRSALLRSNGCPLPCEEADSFDRPGPRTGGPPR